MTTRRTTSRPLFMIAAMVCWWGTVASAQPGEDGRFLMLDRELRASLVSVAAIGDASVRMTGADGAAEEIPLAEIMVLAPGWWRPGTAEMDVRRSGDGASSRRVGRPARGASGNRGMILLTDGRRLVGRLVIEGGTDRVMWDHDRLGRSFFSLDDVRRILVNPVGGAPGAGAARDANDRVVMTNGDAVTGFVDSIGEVVAVESDGRTIELSVKQVAVIDLANPSRAPKGTRVWLTDGSVAGAKGFAPAAGSGEFRLVVPTPTDGAAAVGLSPVEVAGIVPDAARVVPLASLPIESERGVGERLYALPAALRWQGVALGASWRETVAPGDQTPPLDAPDIELPGPMQVEWTLPAGTVRVAGWAEVPMESRVWAEFTLVFEGVSESGVVSPLASESMSGTRPVVEFNIEVPITPSGAADRLRVSIQPGPRGPIQDRVILRRTLLLVEPSEH